MAELRPARGLQTGRLLRRGMAGESRPAAPCARLESGARLRRRRAPREAGVAFAGGVCLALLLALFLAGAAEAQVTSTRMWPARDYTRLTIEARADVKYEI